MAEIRPFRFTVLQITVLYKAQAAIAGRPLEIGLEPDEVTPHKLWHTIGKSLVDAGVSLDRVAMLMGHQDLATTAIYTTPSRADLVAAVEKIAWKE